MSNKESGLDIMFAYWMKYLVYLKLQKGLMLSSILFFLFPATEKIHLENQA